MDMVQDYYGEDFEAELNAFVECIHEADLDHEDTLWDLCTDDADLRYWRTLLADELPVTISETSETDNEAGSFATSRYEARRHIELYADVLDALGETGILQEVYERHYLDIRAFCLRYARLLADEGDLDRARTVAEEELEAFSNSGNIRDFLIDAYADRDPERYKTLLQEQFCQSGDWEYYEQLRSCCSEDDWDEIVPEFEAQFEESNARRLIDLYLREDRTADAFETVIETARKEPDDAFWRAVGDNALTILSEYRDAVADYDPETYYEVYEERLEPFLADTTGRGHCQTVVEYLEEMRELGFNDDFEAFVAHLKEKHSNRPAFLDELEALGR